MQQMADGKPIAFIADVHANLEALKAVISALNILGVKRIINLGDLVGYGPDPIPCIEAARRFSVNIMGNHDWALFDPERHTVTWASASAQRIIFWTAREMKKRTDLLKFVRAFPKSGQAGGMVFTHGCPVANNNRARMNTYVYPDPEKYLPVAMLFDGRLAFVGHTHLPMVGDDNGLVMLPSGERWEMELDPLRRYIINPGSVGQPRDHNPRPSFCILDGNQCSFYRVDYDVRTTMQKILANRVFNPAYAARLRAGR